VELCLERHVVEQLAGRLKEFRRVVTLYDKLTASNRSLSAFAIQLRLLDQISGQLGYLAGNRDEI
jgi:transposase